MKNIENIWEEEKVKTKKVLAGFTAAAIAASMITGCGSGAKTETAVSTEAETTAAEEKETTAADGTGYGKEERADPYGQRKRGFWFPIRLYDLPQGPGLYDAQLYF